MDAHTHARTQIHLKAPVTTLSRSLQADSTKIRAFADGNSNVAKTTKFVSERLENIVG